MSDEQAGATSQQDGPDDREPTPERQEELRAACAANIATSKAPYTDVDIRTLGELQWILGEHGWGSTRPESVEDDFPFARRANLAYANFRNTDLRGAHIFRADLHGADLRHAKLVSVDLDLANLSDANLAYADMKSASLALVNLQGAILVFADLSSAYLGGADLSGSNFVEANLSGANLEEVKMNAAAVPHRIKMDENTRLGDIVWNGVPLIQVDWGQVPRLGDELAITEAENRRERIHAYRDVARYYRGLSRALRSQGLVTYASAYRLREQRMERAALLREGRLGSWLFSLLLDLVAGYGERPGRISVSYVTVVLAFAAAYFGVTHLLETHLSSLTWDESLVLSLTSFHGRGFFPGTLPLGDWVARLAAVEAVIGLFIELILLATFSRRFLGS